MKKKLLFIYNPNAGKCKIKDQLSDILDEFCDVYSQVIVSPTKKRGDATEFVIEYEDDRDCEIVACSGGDGTLHEIVNGMMKRNYRVPILYIPTGSTNDFGKSLNIPKNMVEASSMVNTGKLFPCDVASFNSKYFVYTAAFGIFTETSYSTSQTLKNMLGHFAYIINGATELTKIQRYNMTVEYDGQIAEGVFIFGAISSTSSIGGMKSITRDDVEYDDGYYEMILIRDGRIYEYPALINDILRGNVNSEKVIYAKVKNIKIKSEEDVPWCLDGEFGGIERFVNINVHQRAITFMIPDIEEKQNLLKIEE
ncbi:MAG: diacylglycerol kinase family lipid kinase [Clostridiales bacterium]|nr:diacylglycerol kinase family lipid kinase [Clostridiales bacterium]